MLLTKHLPTIALPLLSFLSNALGVVALHASEAGVIDWHKPQIGVPLIFSQSLAPTFHRVTQKHSNEYGIALNDTTQSVILTATSANVLAALDPVKGGIAWRYLFEPQDPIISFKANQNFVAALSGPGGSTLRAFDALSGDLISERRLHHPDAGLLFEPPDIGSNIVFVGGSSSDVYVLTNGHVLRRIDTLKGEERWEWRSVDMSSSVIFSKIIVAPSTVYLIGLTKSVASYTLRVEALTSDGEHLTSADIPSSVHNGLSDFITLSNYISASSEDPRVVWLEKGAIKSVALNAELSAKPVSLKGTAYVSLLSVGLNERGYFVGLKKDGVGRVFKLDDEDEKGLKQIWEFKEFVDPKLYSTSLFAGGFDKEGLPYIGRVFWSHVLHAATGQVYAPHAVKGTGMARGFTFPFATNAHGIVSHIALDVANPTEDIIIPRFFLTTGTGALQLWQFDRLQWSREEALSEIRFAEMVELPEKQAVTTMAGEENESWIERLTRQMGEAKDFPSYIVNFSKRFLTGSYASVSASASESQDPSSGLYRDTFGFRKVIVVATPRGIIYGLNSADGSILWSRILGLGWAAEVGARILPVRMYVRGSLKEGESPRVAIVTQRVASNGLVDAVVFEVNAITGSDALGKSLDVDVLQGVDVVQGELVEAFMLPDERKTIAMLDKYLQVYLYPDTPESKSSFASLTPKVHFPLSAEGRLVGHRINPVFDSIIGKYTAQDIWTTHFGPLQKNSAGASAPTEDIVTLFAKKNEPVASHGKVLADRSTLYKYLAPGLIGAITRSKAGEGSAAAPGTASKTASIPTCGIYLLDGAKGTIIYHSRILAPGGSSAGCSTIQVSLTENWLAYTYYSADVSSPEGQAKGHHVVSVEIYEGKGVDDKTYSSEASIYSNRSAEVTVFEQTFILPHGVSALTTTSTKFGIATKDLLVANDRGQIQTLPRRLFDPRRPNRKPTAQEQSEEWLMQYDPIIPIDPRRTTSHNYRLGRISAIHTSPSLLESTSLIFAHGLDLFGSRVAPSGTFDVLSESFNKAQLVLTVLGLGAAIAVTRPMVRRKKLKERWYY